MCEYCDTEKVKKVILDNESCESDGVYIDGSNIEVSVSYETAYFTANYCFMCGRNLKGKSPAARLLDILGGEF